MKKKIGNSHQPNINKSLGAYIEAEETRKLNLPFTGFIDIYDDYDYDDGDLNYLLYDDMADRMQHLNGANDVEDFDAEYYSKHKFDKKQIYFYPNICTPETRKRFNNLSEFNDFCNENDFLMTDRTVNDLMKRNVSHCCLDPDDLETGDKVIVSDTSYGGLVYTVCDDYDEIYD